MVGGGGCPSGRVTSLTPKVRRGIKCKSEHSMKNVQEENIRERIELFTVLLRAAGLRWSSTRTTGREVCDIHDPARTAAIEGVTEFKLAGIGNPYKIISTAC